MKDVRIVKPRKIRAGRLERGIALASLWIRRPAQLWSILSMKGAPAKASNVARWFDLASRVMRPICCNSWDAKQKVARIVDHHAVLRELGGILSPTWREPRALMTLSEIGAKYSVKIDEPDWMINDGLATISLWHEYDRVFSVTFILARESGRLAAYIGGLQGRNTSETLELYRQITKDTKGVRPRDLIIEISRMFFRAIGVTRIYAVSEMSRNWNNRFADELFQNIPSLDYDRAWEERGGRRINTHWFQMPVQPIRRDEEDIPARKRALYRQRYAMLDDLECEMGKTVIKMIPGVTEMRVASLRLADNLQPVEDRILA